MEEKKRPPPCCFYADTDDDALEWCIPRAQHHTTAPHVTLRTPSIPSNLVITGTPLITYLPLTALLMQRGYDGALKASSDNSAGSSGKA